MATKLFVGNVDFNATENDLQDHFSKAGTVLSANIVQDRMTGKARGFAFVEMSSEEEAQRAVSELNGSEFAGRKLTVNEARPKEERPRSSGGGGGGYRGGGGGGDRGGGGGGGRSDRGDRGDRGGRGDYRGGR